MSDARDYGLDRAHGKYVYFVNPDAWMEPTLDDEEFFGSPVTHDLDDFKKNVNVIVTNRWNNDLEDVEDKVFTRDLFKRD